ncbi:hypothetical protein IH979_02090 [Patescibacteria group bacterium]|nr:hypothetical protein [Patescibacteria group bacterium]
MSQDIIKQLKNLKTSPQAGWVSQAVKSRVSEKLMEAVGGVEEVGTPALGGAPAYYKWSITNLVSKPIAASVAVIVLIVGGWTTVNASSTSLPGETLYPVKLATERAQLQFSSSGNKAVLHSTFAKRRLNEAVALSQSDRPEKKEQVRIALESFQKELELAGDELRKLQQEGNEETVQVASQIDQTIDQVNSVIDQTAAQDGESVVQVEDAREVTREISDSVVDVVVDTHEASASDASKSELQKLFRDELAEIRSRQTFDLGRLVVIENTFDANPDLLESVHLPTSLQVMKFTITNATSRVPEAMNLMAAGGHRAAFDILRQTRAALLEMESQLAQIEISITNALASLDDETDQSKSEEADTPAEGDGALTSETTEGS